MSTTLAATPAKLSDGTWGARVSALGLKIGTKVTITTRAGKTWDAQIDRIVSEKDGVTTVATRKLSTASTYTPAPRYTPSTHSNTCDECGRGGATRTAYDSSGLEGRVCNGCARESSHTLSFA